MYIFDNVNVVELRHQLFCFQNSTASENVLTAMKTFIDAVYKELRKNDRENITISKTNILVNSKRTLRGKAASIFIDEALDEYTNNNPKWEHTKGSQIHLHAKLSKGCQLITMHTLNVKLSFIIHTERI